MNKTELLEKYEDTLLKIVYRNEEERYLLNGYIYDVKGDLVYSLKWFDEDLIDKEHEKKLDIMKIFRCNGRLIWERREEKPILTLKEKEYLKAVIKPFKDKVDYMFIENEEFEINLKNNDFMYLPTTSSLPFKFEHLERERCYTLKELGLED